MTKKDDQNLVNLSFSRIETSANFAGRYCLVKGADCTAQLYHFEIYTFTQINIIFASDEQF